MTSFCISGVEPSV